MKFKILLPCLFLPLMVGAIAGYFTTSALSVWYNTLNQPSFNPPNWIFGPVWTTLYVIMGYSAYLIHSSANSPQKQKALLIYYSQLTLNFFWSFLFFYFNRIDLALIEIIFLLSFIILMIIQFRKINQKAAYINIPYLIWVSFATILNLAYYLKN